MKTKAAILREIGKQLSIENIEIPELEKGQVLVKILYSGICHSQINEINGLRGEDKYLPHLLGHEGSGIVENIGPNVTKVKKGDLVVLTWIKGNGIDNPSSTYKDNKNNNINSGAITTFSDYSIISENRLVKLSTNISLKTAALLGCAIPTGAGIIKNEISIKKDDSLVIFGIGGIGSSALLYAKAIGCKKIIAIDINDEKLEFAKANGAHHTINSLNKNVFEKINEYTNKELLDYAIECTGIPFVMESAMSIIKNTGKVVIAGNPKQGSKISLDPYDLIKGKKIVGTWGGATNPDIDISYYEQLINENKLKVDCLISKIYSLEQINEAIDDLSKGKIIRGLIKL
jgi:S-(hydroxymethyl)glutathione dehydrogenase/alcohol dehydrogenase